MRTHFYFIDSLQFFLYNYVDDEFVTTIVSRHDPVNRKLKSELSVQFIHISGCDIRNFVHIRRNSKTVSIISFIIYCGILKGCHGTHQPMSNRV